MAASRPNAAGNIHRIAARTGDGSSGTVLAFSSFEPHELRAYAEAMAEDLPDIALLIDRMPTAVLTQRLLRPDPESEPCMVLGWADTAAATPGISGVMAEPDMPDFKGGFIRPTAFSIAFVGDRDGLASIGLGLPASWSDLAHPALRGRVAFPDPRVSGAGFLALATLLQAHGSREGWAMMQEIDRNVSAYLPSAQGPAAAVGGGGDLVGVTVKIAATHRVSESSGGLAMSEPAGVIGMEAEVYGMTRSARNPAAVQRVLRWLLGDRSAGLFSTFSKIDLRQGVETSAGLFRIDPDRATRDRPDMLARFSSLA